MPMEQSEVDAVIHILLNHHRLASAKKLTRELWENVGKHSANASVKESFRLLYERVNAMPEGGERAGPRNG